MNRVPIKLFYSYSHKDGDLRDELNNHLSILQNEGFIDEWHDRKITAGSEWENEIDVYLKSAEIILLLISSDFLASNYCSQIEMKAALEMHDKKDAVVIPVILRECNWGIAPFKKLQVLPKDGKAIISKHWHSKDEGFKEVSLGIQKKIEELWKAKEDILIEEKEPDPDIFSTPKLEIQLNEYPRPKPYFSGRKDELHKLNDAYNSYPFLFIEGAGGIGKTQLVAKFIEEVVKKSNVVWFECTQTSQPDDIIRGTGLEELLKGKDKTQREKFSAFKDKIEEFDLTIILDNYQEVQNNENFKSLLSFMNEYIGKGHLIIIGRDNIVTPNLQVKRIHIAGLGKDSLSHARRLLEYAYPENMSISDESLESVCDQLLGYPLAIDLAVYLLSENVTPENIIKTVIKEAKSGENYYERISQRLLNEIFTRIDAEEYEKEFLKAFSVYLGSVTEEAAKAIISDEVFQNAVRKLKRRNLLTYEDGFYGLHPLIREFCYEKLEDKEAAHLKAAHFFQSKRTLKFDPDLEEKIFYHLSLSNKWSEISITIIEKGRDFILYGHLDRLKQMIGEVKEHVNYESLFYVLEGDIAQIKGEWDLAFSFFKKSMEVDDEAIKAEGMIKCGEIEYRKGNLNDAQSYFESAIAHTKLGDLKKMNARASNDIGIIYEFYGDLKESLAFYLDSLEIRKEIGDKPGIADSLNNIGGLKRQMGDNKEALRLAEQSLKIRKEIGDKSGIADSLNNIGVIKNEQGDKKDALSLYEQGLQTYREIGDKFGIANSLNNLGVVKKEQGDKKEALSLYEQSLQIREEIGDKSGIAYSLNSIGVIKKEQGDNKEALKLYEQSLKIREEIGNKSDIANSLNNIGYLYYKNLEIKRACFYLVKSYAIYELILSSRRYSVKLSLDSIRKEYKEVFVQSVKEAYDSLEDELKNAIDLNDVLGIPIRVTKVGRNEPCPCGSGRKYKQCHGK